MNKQEFENLSYPLPDTVEIDIPITITSSHLIESQFEVYKRRYNILARIATLLFYITKNHYFLKTVYRYNWVGYRLYEAPPAGEPMWVTYETAFE